MKNYRDNEEGVKHGAVYLQLRYCTMRESYEIKTLGKVCEKGRIITGVKWAVKEQMKT